MYSFTSVCVVLQVRMDVLYPLTVNSQCSLIAGCVFQGNIKSHALICYEAQSQPRGDEGGTCATIKLAGGGLLQYILL